MAAPAATAQTVNERLLDRAVRRSLLLERLENAEVKAALGFLNRDVLPAAEEKLASRLARIAERGFDTGPVTTKRTRDLVRSVRKVTSEGFKKVNDRLQDRMVLLAGEEVAWQDALLRESIPVQMATTLPSAGQLRSIVASKPFEGRVLREHWRAVDSRLVGELERQIKIGIATGETTDQIVRRVRGTAARKFKDGVFGAARRQTEATVRSAVTHVSNASREALYLQNQDIVKSVMWVATLDGATCPECAGLDSQTFEVGFGSRPPAHHMCRCTTVPVTRSWKELGISLGEAPPGTRASMGGQVPAKLSYGRWLKRQPRHIQDTALGPARAELFRSGQVPIRGFTGSGGKVIPLDQLRRAELALEQGERLQDFSVPSNTGGALRADRLRKIRALELKARSGPLSADETVELKRLKANEASFQSVFRRKARDKATEDYLARVRPEAEAAGRPLTAEHIERIKKIKGLEFKAKLSNAEIAELKRLKANEASRASVTRRILRRRGIGPIPPPRPVRPAPPKPRPRPRPRPSSAGPSRPASVTGRGAAPPKLGSEAEKKFNEAWKRVAAARTKRANIQRTERGGWTDTAHRTSRPKMKATVKEAFDEERLAVRGALDELESAGALEGRFETDWLMAAERADRELKAAGIDLDSIQRDILARARMGGRYLDSEAQGVMDKMLAELERLNGENAWKVSKRTNIPAGTRDVRTGRLRATKQSAHKEIADRLRTAGELQRNAALKSRILGRPGRTTGSADSLERLLGSAHHNIHDRKLESIRWARKESRAWASEGSNMINFGEGSTSSVVHEFGHHIEYRNANVKRRMLQWRESRAIGESKTAIYQGTTEIGYRDGFVDHYVGKTYVSGWTETVSMGLEGFADVSSLRKLIMQDPEHLKLIWAMLRGY